MTINKKKKCKYTLARKCLYFDLQPFKIDVLQISWTVHTAHIREHVHSWCSCLPYTASQGQVFL
jgi:hypothetical protein